MTTLIPVAIVRSPRTEATDDDWGDVVSQIELHDDFPPEALSGIEAFSHVEVVFHFDRVNEGEIQLGTRHPRSNSAWPKVGIFAQRGKNRPNRIGVSCARLLRKEDRTLIVRGLDAIDGSPVFDIKPVMAEFLPIGEVRQPLWSHELMIDYWKRESEQSTGDNA